MSDILQAAAHWQQRATAAEARIVELERALGEQLMSKQNADANAIRWAGQAMQARIDKEAAEAVADRRLADSRRYQFWKESVKQPLGFYRAVVGNCEVTTTEWDAYLDSAIEEEAELTGTPVADGGAS